MKKEFQNHLTKEEKSILVDRGTESPHSGKFNHFHKEGDYFCKGCSSKLFSSASKFDSHCGWPSFDDHIDGSLKKIADNSLGMSRTEILCSICNGHLGHVFKGENFTEKNTRYCVNSLSLKFKSK